MQLYRIEDPHLAYPIRAVEVWANDQTEAIDAAVTAMMQCGLDDVDEGVVTWIRSAMVVKQLSRLEAIDASVNAMVVNRLSRPDRLEDDQPTN